MRQSVAFWSREKSLAAVVVCMWKMRAQRLSSKTERGQG